jgi:hypothetical protein
MKARTLGIGWAVVLALSAPPFAAATGLTSTTYYVDSIQGSDANSGTTTGAAWKTVGQAARGSLVPGDQVLFRRGGVWYEGLTATRSGTWTNLITFGAYGTGARPVISGAKNLNASAYRWTASAGGTHEYRLEAGAGGNPNLAEVKNVFLNGTNVPRGGALGTLANQRWNWGNNDSLGYTTVYFRCDSGNPNTLGLIEGSQSNYAIMIEGRSHIRVENLELRQGQGPWHGTVTVRESCNVVFSNCVIHESYQYPVWYSIHATNTVIENCWVYGNRTTGTYGSVISFENSVSNTIRGCKIHDTTASLGDTVKIYDTDDSLIERNEVWGPGANGIYCRPMSDRNVIRYNFVHDMNGIGLQIRENSDDNRAYCNIFLNNYGPVMQSDGLNGTDPGITGTKFYNNTVVSTGAANSIHIFGTNRNCEVKNNLVIAGLGDALLVARDSVAGTALANNNYRNTSGMMISYNGTNYTASQFAAYKAASGDTSSLCTNPMFAAASPRTAADIELRAGSPVINAGVLISGMNRDYFGVTVPSGGAPDIGAAEYVTDVPPRPPSRFRAE